MKKTLFAFAMALALLSATACTGNHADNEAATDATAETQVEKFAPQPRKEKNGPKSVLIISSSPRRGGNSEALCTRFMQGAQEAGNKVKMLNINDYNISYFNQPEYDRKAAAATTDDAATIIAKMKDADVIVLASPVYFYSVTAQLKALIDRTYGYEKDLGEKEFYFIATSTDSGNESTDGAFETMHGFTRCLYGSVERGVIRGNGARNRGDIESHPAMEQAYEMGKGV